ncbi:hypothetical protein Bbelb_241150 [Branchiostoma belcheri]|nr:hypothetical protein Bbelb_241150 [Branchiostoma belcheri]
MFRASGVHYCIVVGSRIEQLEDSALNIQQNGIIDNEVQKGFLEGVSGCVEHSLVLNEIIRDARAQSRTVHVAWLDLQNAFGSVPHDLIHLALQRYHIPQHICNYVKAFYSNLTAQVRCPEFSSDPFQLNVGTFQGDTLSVAIFLPVINLPLEYLRSEAAHGYTLKDKTHVTFAFADDIALTISRSRSLQRILNTLDRNLRSIHLYLKPKKCKTLSICGGSAKDVAFCIGSHPMDNIIKTPFKFLGGYVTARGSAGQVADILRESIIGSKEKNGIIMNIDESPIRGEYKCEIYRVYVQGAIKYLLSVHDTTRSHLQKLSSSVTQYLKKWAGMKRSANSGILYHSQGLGLISVEQIYLQQHATVIASAVTIGDASVQNALQAKVKREGTFTRKRTGNLECHTLVKDTLTSLSSPNSNDNQATPHHTKDKLCRRVKAHIRQTEDNKIEEHCRSLSVQGNWVELIELEQSDTKWRSSLCNSPRGVSEFALSGMVNWLPTRDNLVRWGKVLSSNCPLCQGHQTLRHVLNSCPVALRDTRYTWRHNSVLKELVTTLQQWYSKSGQQVVIRCDLSRESPEVGTHTTIPPDVLPTSLVPDITIQDPIARGSTIFSDRRPIFKHEIRPRLVGCTSEYRSTLGRTGASYAQAGNELCDLKNRRQLVTDVKNTFRVSASFGRLQKIAGDPENSRDARRNIGRTTVVNVV